MSKDPNEYLCRCCLRDNVPFEERGGGYAYYPFFGGYLCEQCRINVEGKHTFHPLTSYSRTCPKCNPAIWRDKQ